MNDALKNICDRYNEAYCYLFGEGGLMQGTLSDDNAKAAATATVIIQFEKAGGFSKSYSSSLNTTPPTDDGEKCPKCGKPIKKGVNKLGKPYKQCQTCRVWIDAFGGTIPMKE